MSVGQQAAPALAPPAHPCTPEQVREYIHLTGADERAHRVMKLMVQSSKATADKAIPPAMWDEMDARFAKWDVAEMALPAYQKYLSEQDMGALLTFYRSEAGKRVLESQPYIESLTAEAGKQAGQKIGAEIVAKYKDEIVARRKQLDDEAAARSGKSAEPVIQLKQEPK